MVLTILCAICGFAFTTIFCGVLTNMISTDVEKRASGWALALIKRAVKRLPPHLHDRFAEEWAADLTAQPSPLSELIFALGLQGAARQINSAELRRIAPHSLSTLGRIQKRTFDCAMAVPAALILVPLFVIVAILIKLESRGPVFVRQERLGLMNRPLKVLKFRSMYVTHYDSSPSDPNPRSYSRVTRIGRFIRSSSIDELPQLLNVIAGDMSIVGPRPQALRTLGDDPSWLEIDNKCKPQRQVKPGLTGLAQIRNFHDGASQDRYIIDRINADLEYVKGWNILRDFKIIIRTFRVLRDNNSL